jgi:type IV secretory pathway VirB10-like protein
MADTYNKKNNSGYDEFEAEAANKDEIKNPRDKINSLLKQPINLVILIGVVLFIIVLLVKLFSSSKREIPTPISQDKIPPKLEVEPASISPSSATSNQPPSPQTQTSQNKTTEFAPPVAPSLDVNLLNKIDTFTQSKEKDVEDEINTLDLEKIRAELQIEEGEDEEDEEDAVTRKKEESEDSLSFDEFVKNSNKTQLITKRRKIDPENPPPPIIDTSVNGPVDKSVRKTMSDFIFIDSSLDAEFSNDIPNEGKKIPDLGNIVAQGRMIDAILETAIDSSIPGTIRAVVSRDVYAEAGRSILIPKGTRLYGSYSAGGVSSGRVIITWSRILRPDGISLGIDSFASDQFGRAGVQGEVDKKYGEVIASALLLSSIPLVATIATQQITGSKRSSTTISPTGVVTTNKDPIDIATERFSNEIASATEKVVKGIIDTTYVVKISQGTRLKVMVNQDLKLPKYKALTSLNTTVTNSSQ